MSAFHDEGQNSTCTKRSWEPGIARRPFFHPETDTVPGLELVSRYGDLSSVQQSTQKGTRDLPANHDFLVFVINLAMLNIFWGNVAINCSLLCDDAHVRELGEVELNRHDCK
jgi:hypothetical protein